MSETPIKEEKLVTEDKKLPPMYNLAVKQISLAMQGKAIEIDKLDAEKADWKFNDFEKYEKVLVDVGKVFGEQIQDKDQFVSETEAERLNGVVKSELLRKFESEELVEPVLTDDRNT